MVCRLCCWHFIARLIQFLFLTILLDWENKITSQLPLNRNLLLEIAIAVLAQVFLTRKLSRLNRCNISLNWVAAIMCYQLYTQEISNQVTFMHIR